MNKEFRDATLKELESWPGVTMTEESGRKHDKMTLHYNGDSRLVIVASTPSDARALPNHMALVRREVRALGAQRAHVVVGKPKPANPVLREVPKPMEKPMSREKKQAEIFKSIGDLRYSEMLELAGFMRDIATEMNLRRGSTDSWAKMLQAAVDYENTRPTPAREEALAA